MLRPQMFARGKITLGTHPKAICIPREAVLEATENGDKHTGAVFVVADGKAQRREVTLGYSNLVDQEITRGVRAGDDVVTSGQAQIQDGDQVKAASGGSQP
jgi:hypothetical protein